MEKTEQKWLKEIRDNTKQLERIAKRLDAIYRQMDRLDRKTEPTISKMEQVEQRSCDTCKGKDIEGWKNPCLGCTGFAFYEPMDEPQTERPTQCSECKVWHQCFKEKPSYNMIKSRCPIDEPQYDIDKGTISCDNCAENGSYKCSKCDGEIYFKRLAVENEPQTEEDVLREQVRAFMGIVEQMKRGE